MQISIFKKLSTHNNSIIHQLSHRIVHSAQGRVYLSRTMLHLEGLITAASVSSRHTRSLYMEWVSGVPTAGGVYSTAACCIRYSPGASESLQSSSLPLPQPHSVSLYHPNTSFHLTIVQLKLIVQLKIPNHTHR